MSTKIQPLKECSFEKLAKDIKGKRVKGNHLFIDIETFTSNRKATKPTELQTYPYSVHCSWINSKDMQIYNCMTNDLVSFFGFLETIDKNGNLYLTAHNDAKYENHFILQALRYRGYQVFNDWSKKMDMPKPSYKLEGKYVLTKRVKSRNNLSIEVHINKLKIVCEDTYPKTNASLRTIADMLVRAKVMPERFAKSTLDYQKYDRDELLSTTEQFEYSKQIFEQLDDDDLVYIQNDTVILAYLYLYFEIIYPGFDYNKQTYTLNIVDSYVTGNEKANFQLMKKYGRRSHLYYSYFQFAGYNVFDYFQFAYKGGLNFYNDEYLKKVVTNCFSIDINSSYPYQMYSKKYPKEIIGWGEGEFVNLDDFTLAVIELSKEVFSTIINQVESKIIRQMFIKYFSTKGKNDHYFLTNIHLKLIRKFNSNPWLFENLYCESYINFDTQDFQAKEVLNEYYRIKTLGKAKTKLHYVDALNISDLHIKNSEEPFTAEEIYIAKVKMNGIYGAPALRSHFDYFTEEEGEFVNHKNGYTNTERNILFSVFVTAYSLDKLLEPLTYLTASEIDNYFVYCDTDSLYLKKEAYAKIPETEYDKYILGKWDVEHENIEKIYVLNHKKYCYYAECKIQIRCAGVVLSTFDTNMSFEKFIETQFSPNIKVKSTASILNNEGTISIYEREVEMSSGSKYQSALDENYFAQYKEVKNRAEKLLETTSLDEEEDLLYIETEFGSFTNRDFFEDMDIEGKLPIGELKKQLRNIYFLLK